MAAAEEAVAAAEAAAVAGDTNQRLMPYTETAPLELRKWIEEFLANPQGSHHLGSPICPALPAALREDSLRILTIQPSNSLLETITSSLATALETSLGYFQGGANTTTLRATLVVVEGLPPHVLRSTFEDSFNHVRTVAISLGLMSGCFHPYRIRTSRISPDLITMVSPMPIVAFRKLLRSDELSFSEEPENFRRFRNIQNARLVSEKLKALQKEALIELRTLEQNMGID